MRKEEEWAIYNPNDSRWRRVDFGGRTKLVMSEEDPDSGVKTNWTMDSEIIPNILTRMDKTPTGFSRTMEKFYQVKLLGKEISPSIIRCSIENLQRGGLLGDSLTLNAEGYLWRNIRFPEKSHYTELQIKYVSGDVSEAEFTSSNDQKVFTTVLNFKDIKRGKISYKLSSLTVPLDSDEIFEDLKQTGSAKFSFDLNEPQRLTEGEAILGEEFNFFRTFFHIVDTDRDKKIIGIRIVKKVGEETAVTIVTLPVHIDHKSLLWKACSPENTGWERVLGEIPVIVSQT